MYFIKGVNGQIELRKNRVVISRKGLLGFAAQGLAGNKEIPIKNITAVQFKEPGGMTNGYIQFSMLGGVESKGGIRNATQDENTVMFSSAQAPQFRIVKEYIDSIIDEEPMEFDALSLPRIAAATDPSVAGEAMTSGQTMVATPQSARPQGGKSIAIAYLLWFFFGMLGAHRFYLGETKTGAAILILTILAIALTTKVGAFLILIPVLWVLADLFLIPKMARKSGQQMAVATA